MKFPFKLLLLAGVTTFSASAQEKFNAMSTMIIDTYERVVSDPSLNISMLTDLPFEIKSIDSRTDIKVNIIISLNEGYSAEDVEARGFEIISELDNIIVACGSMEDIIALEKCDFVKSLSFGNKRMPLMDTTREVTGAQAVQNGTGLPQKYDGTGVIAGIWDTGIDVNHLNFLDSKGNSRISRFWFFNGEGGSSTEYTNETISQFQTDNKIETHGTHTLGCLAGSWDGVAAPGVATMNGSSSKWSLTGKNPYYGMAPGAEIAAGAGALYDANTIAAITNITNYATSVKKPFVINLSIGSNDGPHDGSDEIGQALEAAARRGAIIFVSAGNEGDQNVSVVKDFTSGDTSVSTFVETTSAAYGQLSLWSSSSQTFTLTLQVYNRNTNTVEYSYDFTPSDGSSTFYLGNNGITNEAFTNAFTASSYIYLTRSTNKSTNNRYSVSGIINLSLNSSKNPGGRNYALGLKVTGSAGQRVDITASNGTEFTNYGINGYTNGSSEFSINDIACSPYVIAVGSWNARNSVPAKGGVLSAMADKVGVVSSFSSYGTTIDGRKLPDICAPGLMVVSSISRFYYDNKLAINYANYVSADQKTPNSYAINKGINNYWYNESGTSMASPVAAGGVALWLQANPNLTVEDVKSIIKRSANTTNLPAATPEARWGGGKLDVLAGIKEVLNYGGVNDITVESEKILFTPMGLNNWEIFMAGAKNINAEVFNLSGGKVAEISFKGDTANLSMDNFEKGIYVVTVNGANAQRVFVR